MVENSNTYNREREGGSDVFGTMEQNVSGYWCKVAESKEDDLNKSWRSNVKTWDNVSVLREKG
jgi:hypothetical protein